MLTAFTLAKQNEQIVDFYSIARSVRAHRCIAVRATSKRAALLCSAEARSHVTWRRVGHALSAVAFNIASAAVGFATRARAAIAAPALSARRRTARCASLFRPHYPASSSALGVATRCCAVARDGRGNVPKEVSCLVIVPVRLTSHK